MAWNPSPKVKAARDIAGKFKKKMVIVIMVDEEKLEYASYGETKELCNEAKKVADKCYDAAFKALS
tara:strand:+ start:3944 stop:4141 length:198 start_codon:yes stop_codon:yes gene_type:complete